MTNPAPHSTQPKTGVLLINLGTPDAPTASAIRRYLREFLLDRRVVDVPRLLWWPILNLVILNFRPQKLAPRYASVWTEAGSPLLAISRQQAAALRQRLGSDVPVALAMCYGNPSIPAALAELDAADARRIVVLPLYPQYSATTTAAALDAVFAALLPQRWMPELRTINSYHDHPAYIAALAQSVETHWVQQGRAEHLLMSFHGIPQRYFDLGDPYHCQCHKTARLLAEALGLSKQQWSLSFQSRFGREPWLKPYTDETLARLSQRGIRRLDVISPGFSADCLETLEEISVEYRERFSHTGGGSLRYIAALNAAPSHIQALADVLAPSLSGWLPEASTPEQWSQRAERMQAVQATSV